MLITALIVLNIPVYLFIGWLVFDTKDDAADTFLDTTIAVIKIILVPGIVRVLLGDDDDEAWGLLPLAAFLFACAGVVYGEYYLITTHIL